MNTRIQQFLTAENLSQTMFADTLGVSRATISNIVAGRSRPGYDFFTSLMQHYPSLNIEWVLTGRGKMYKDATKNAEKESSGTLSPFGGDPESEDEGDALSFTAQNAAQRLQKAQDEREPKTRILPDERPGAARQDRPQDRQGRGVLRRQHLHRAHIGPSAFKHIEFFPIFAL